MIIDAFQVIHIKDHDWAIAVIYVGLLENPFHMGLGISVVKQTGKRVGDCDFQAVANIIAQLIAGEFARYKRIQPDS